MNAIKVCAVAAMGVLVVMVVVWIDRMPYSINDEESPGTHSPRDIKSEKIYSTSTFLDTGSNTALANISRFSTWALASVTPTAVVDDESGSLSPPVFSLLQNTPNSFNPDTVIRYTIPRNGPVQLVIYNIRGQKVQTLVDGIQAAGAYRVAWNGRNSRGYPVGSGLYLYGLSADGSRDIKRMILLK